jgi:hypothetical protein
MSMLIPHCTNQRWHQYIVLTFMKVDLIVTPILLTTTYILLTFRYTDLDYKV